MDTAIVADTVAGFMYAFTQHDDKAEMEACFKDSPQFEADICDAYANILTKDNRKVLEALQNLIQKDLPLFQQYMAGCTGQGTVMADFNVVAAWYKFWMSQGTMRVY